MKRLTSLLLALILLATASAVLPANAADSPAFHEGDELYLKIESPSNWADGAILYVNFTDATRAENGDKSIIIADADKSRYSPREGVVYDAASGLCKYTVTAADAGATVMRFWRGNSEKLWNESVALHAEQLSSGVNTAVVTGWTNTGYTTSYGAAPSPTEPQDDPPADAPVTAFASGCLYAHAAAGADDSEAWVKWYNVSDTYYIFLPSSAKAYDTVELYSTLPADAKLDSTTLPANGRAFFKPEARKSYTLTCDSVSRTVQFLYSTAEAALWVNNTDSYSGYGDFFGYLKADKSNSVAASGAIATPDGAIENTPVKKMKGRGNTSWNANKKGFNVTFDSAISLSGMPKCKKFSLISNFQDAAMARNRILYDLAGEVGVPFSSQSRFIDLYTNGVYQGTYQMCQKIDVGKNTLIDSFSGDDYLDENGGVKADFCFVTEIDSSPAADDFHFTAKNNNSLTMKAPELSEDDPNYAAVRTYVRNKYGTMYNRLQYDNIGNYLDIPSMAKVYLINELGKNWDSGASSFYFTYMPDADGVYKFYAAPVWDYDNSLGNANGVSSDLRRLGITDYVLPSGWFSTKKNGYSGPNILAEAVKNPVIMAEVRRAWFEDFLPALKKLTSDGDTSGRLWSSDVYADSLRGSAEMNYKIWGLVTNSVWIANHSNVRKYNADYTYNSYGQVTGVALTQDSRSTTYDQYTFDGQFDYMMDWTTSRAAWISAQYIADYTPSAPTEPPTEAPTEAPTLPPDDTIEPDLTDAIAAWVFDADGKTEGDKLTEYGSSDGYAATLGEGTMRLSVSGAKNRALEWSAPEYGTSGTLMTPIMAAGSKNPWGEPSVTLELPAKGYDALTLTMVLAGSNKAPASWKLQYSADGKSFCDIDGAAFTITAESRKKLTAYFDKSALPDVAYSVTADDLVLRLVPADMTTVDGGNALDTPTSGELAISAVVVQGHRLTDSDILLGDSNLDGEIEIADATVIQRYLLELRNLTSRALRSADTDKDGDVTIVDATVIQRALLGMPTKYLKVED